jgi:hypothetical protein
LAPLTRGIQKEAAVARERITAEPLAHECAQAVEPFAQASGRYIGAHRDLPRRPDHVRSRSTSMSPARFKFSTR